MKKAVVFSILVLTSALTVAEERQYSVFQRSPATNCEEDIPEGHETLEICFVRNSDKYQIKCFCEHFDEDNRVRINKKYKAVAGNLKDPVGEEIETVIAEALNFSQLFEQLEDQGYYKN